MTDEVNGVSGTVSLNNSDFKTATSEINRELRLVESSFRSSAASLQDWTKDATGLEARIKSLNAEIDLQSKKVEATRAEYARLVQVHGEGSKAAQDMEIRLNKETEKLNGMKLELGQTEVALKDVNNETKDAAGGITALAAAAAVGKAALSGLQGVGQGLVLELKAVATVIKGELAVALGVLKVGVGSIIALGGAALVVGGLIAGLTFKAASAADQLGELSDKTGLSTSRLQELGFIGKIVGTDLETVTSANARMIRSMASARGGTGTAAKAFQELGIKVKDAHGNLRDANTVFGEVLDALGNIKDPTERDAAAMQIFGKNAQELNPLIKLGSKGMAEMSAEARNLGAVVSAQTIQALGDLQDQLDALKLGLSGVGTSVLGAFAPFFSGVLTGATGILERIVGVVRGSGGDFGKMAKGLGAIFQDVIIGLAAQIPDLLQTGLTIVTVIIQAIGNALPDLIFAAVSIINTLASFIIANLPMLSDVALKLISSLADAFLPELPLLIDTGLKIIETLINAVTTSLPTLLPKLVETATQIVTDILTALQTAMPQLADSAKLIIETLIKFLKGNLVQLIQVGIPLIRQLIDAILPELPMLVDAALLILVALASAIAQELPTLIPEVAKIIPLIDDVILQNLPLIALLALALITTLSQGLVAALPILLSYVVKLVQAMIAQFDLAKQNFFNSAAQWIISLGTGIVQSLPGIIKSIQTIVNGITSELGKLGSKMLSIGTNLVAGLWKGIKDRWAALLKDFSALVDLLPQAVKDALGIHSPSSVGIAISKNFVGSLATGGQSMIGEVARTFAGIGRQLAASTAGASSGDSFQTINRDNLTLDNKGVINFIDANTQRSVASQARDKVKRF